MESPRLLETEVLRVVVGNNSTTAHPVLGTIPVKGCFPLPIKPAGQTINTVGVKVLGISTTFLGGAGAVGATRVEVGDYIANTNGVCRRVMAVRDDTYLTIEAAFPVDLTGAVLAIVRKNYYRYILAASTGTVAASLQEQRFAVNDKFIGDGAPVSYDVSTASCEISFTLSL